MAPKTAQTGTCLFWVGQIGQGQQKMHKCVPRGFHAPPRCAGLQMHVALVYAKTQGLNTHLSCSLSPIGGWGVGRVGVGGLASVQP